MQFEFDSLYKATEVSPTKASSPRGYTGLYTFHKYWGKKPHEPLAFAIEQLTDEGDTVLDPFVGSGTVARESLLRNRRFIGFDINPVAIELTRLLVSPPRHERLNAAFRFVKKSIKDRIDDSYRLQDDRIASHYLWKNDVLKRIWIRGYRGIAREELIPSPHDLKLIEEFNSYNSIHIRNPNFFSNSRINTHTGLEISDILTNRAQRNLDLLLDCIHDLPGDIQKSLALCITSASGQMTKMVFAITGRGKTKGQASPKIEVGSWVIGYWRPELHFEVNVWNCFERRILRLLKALKNGDTLHGLKISDSMENFYDSDSSCHIACEPCQTAVGNIRDNSVNLIITDPPHSDRVPYLELSELWNSILGTYADYDSEIVVSNAKERRKTSDTYNQVMENVVKSWARVLRKDAFLVLLYNARRESDWEFVSRMIDRSDGLEYLGIFPCNYSANSVIQDNRKGALKSDFALVFGKPKAITKRFRQLENIPGWSREYPKR